MENETMENLTGNDTDVLVYVDDDTWVFYLHLLDWAIISIGFLLILAAIVSLYSMIRKDHVAPIYIINLLISDIIQLCCLLAINTEDIVGLSDDFLFFGIFASVGFMVCIAMERYLIIAWPLWYRFRRNIKTSLLVCAVVWILPFLFFVLPFWFYEFEISVLGIPIFLLLPFPLLVFFLVGTIRALSAARSVPADEKRRIVAILVTVLLIYTLLFLPYIILIILFFNSEETDYFELTVFILLKFSPLADLIMYFVIRKGSSDKLLAALCCGKTCYSAKSSYSVNQETSSQNNEMSALHSQNI